MEKAYITVVPLSKYSVLITLALSFDNAVETYIDDIEAHIEGDVDPEEFMTLADDIQEEKVKAAIADNSEAIFDKDIFA